jgi:hypothetical protein
MARKGWSSLSPGYRARLEKNGVSKGDYERGESIKSARGHKATPERPSQAISNPTQYPVYQRERDKLVSDITNKKQHWFSTAPVWNPTRSANKFKKDPPSMAELRRWNSLSRDEWLDAIREDDTAKAYLGYH